MSEPTVQRASRARRPIVLIVAVIAAVLSTLVVDTPQGSAEIQVPASQAFGLSPGGRTEAVNSPLNFTRGFSIRCCEIFDLSDRTGNLVINSREVTITGLQGVTGEYRNGQVNVICTLNDDFLNFPFGCPSTGDEVTVTYAGLGAQVGSGEIVPLSGTRIFKSLVPTTTVLNAPDASFTFSLSDTNPREVQFVNTSTHPDGKAMTYSWRFEEGETSTEENPVHEFSTTGSFNVFLTAIDSDGVEDVFGAEVVIPTDVIVNSTGDGEAQDPGTLGCDTGGTVDGEPECTLRAALEVANEPTAGTAGASRAAAQNIRFDISGGGTPTITLTEALPVPTSTITIDGTTQPESALVRVSGGGLEGAILSLGGDGSAVKGLVLDDADEGISVEGADAMIEGNVFGADATGSTAGSLILGVGVRPAGANATVSGNHFAASGTGVAVDATGATVDDNLIGVNESGASALGDTILGVLVQGADATVTGNTVRATGASILVLGASATGADVTDNRVGVAKSASTPLENQARGIRIDGAPGATVSGNTVVPGGIHQAGIEVIGGQQTFGTEEGGVFFNSSNSSDDSPVTGGTATVGGNTVGAAAIGADPLGDMLPTHGILVWDEAPDVTVSGNTVAGSDQEAVKFEGGADHEFKGNFLGLAAGDVKVPKGVLFFDTPNALVDGNEIRSDGTAVSLRGPTTSAVVASNALLQPSAVATAGTASRAAGTGNGVFVDAGVNTTEITGNVIEGFDTGIDVDDGTTTVSSNDVDDVSTGIEVSVDDAEITDNTVDDATVGILTTGARTQLTGNDVDGGDVGELGITSSGEESTLEDNSVVSTSESGIVSTGADSTVEDNLLGVTSGGGDVTGNDGDGLVLGGGPVEATGNEVAGSGGEGIEVAAGVVATLKANVIRETTGGPISNADDEPAAPTVEAAVDTSADGTDRTTLLVGDLPSDDNGEIEVFANDSCADGEAERVLGVTRTKAPNATTRIIQLVDRPTADHFTVTFTDSAGKTSELSNCESIGTYPDADGDGSVEPFDDLFGGDEDATKAVVITDDEQVVGLFVDPFDEATGIGGGTITEIGVVDDPAPNAHPDGFELGYGAIRFVIDNLPGGIGSTTIVNFVQLDGPGGAAGDSYWKYGPPTPGAAPEWFDFTGLDSASNTGAEVGASDVAGVGLRRTWILALTDGQRGDNSSPDGVIVDPGGPGFRGATGPDPGDGDGGDDDDPDDTSGESDGENGSLTTTTSVADTGGSATAQETTGDDLPRTGSDLDRTVTLALVFLLAGTAVVLLAHRRRHPAELAVEAHQPRHLKPRQRLTTAAALLVLIAWARDRTRR